jgi:hypothetical protein
MTRGLLLVVAVLAALAAAGCGLGPGEQEPARSGAQLVVTRDFGAEELGRSRLDSLPAGETVMRWLQRRFEVDTRYGGGFVQSIDGLAGGSENGRRHDWFFFVNGIESEVGAASRTVHAGDRVWWDHRDWSTAQRVPAVVGSFPEPFTSGIDGERLPVRIDCASSVDRECDEVERRLRDQGVVGVAKAGLGASSGIEILRIVVAPWSEARREPVAAQLERGPQASGVFARPAADGSEIELLDEAGEVRRTLGPGSGLVAAVRFGDQQPTWFVTGTDAAGVAAAAAALDEEVLHNSFAAAIEDGIAVPLPVRPEAE